jgi:hypothetical protein
MSDDTDRQHIRIALAAIFMATRMHRFVESDDRRDAIAAAALADADALLRATPL